MEGGGEWRQKQLLSSKAYGSQDNVGEKETTISSKLQLKSKTFLCDVRLNYCAALPTHLIF